MIPLGDERKRVFTSEVTRRLPTEERRRQLVDAALGIIAEAGLQRFTTAAIAERVGISEGALFRHFRNKQAIVVAALDRVEEVMFERLPDRTDDPLDWLGQVVSYRVQMVHEHPGIPRIVFSDELAHAAGPEGAARVAALKRRALALGREALLEAQRRGQLVDGVSVEDMTLMVQGLIFALLFGAPAAEPNDAAARAARAWCSLERLLRRP